MSLNVDDDDADAVDPSLSLLIQSKGNRRSSNPLGSVVVSIVSFPLAHIFNMT